MWSFEKLFGESFSSDDERIRSARKQKGENVYREMDKVTRFAEANLHTLKNL
jgi:hypothetical protein